MKNKIDNIQPEDVEIAVNDVFRNVMGKVIKTEHGWRSLRLIFHL